MNLPDKCPFCGAGIVVMENGEKCVSENWVAFECITSIHAGQDIRRTQSRECETAERIRLTARVAELEARCKRLEEAGDVLQSAVVGVEGMTHWQWLAAAHEADLTWRNAKDAKL